MIDFNKENCCACGACKSVCAVGAISMKVDEYGNSYPSVDKSICVNCGKCSDVCPFHNVVYSEHKKNTYAVKLKDKEVLSQSASGGAFMAIASSFLKNNDSLVVGCSLDNNLMPEHTIAHSINDLNKFQGSKYVRSEINIYKDILDSLKVGNKVLFCGTPCQCKAVDNFCKGKSENLFTVEIICHGIIDREFWKDYISFLSKKHKANIVSYKFRSKEKSTGYYASYVTECNGDPLRRNTYYLPSVLSYYYYNFLHCTVFRDACYSCPFADNKRCADVTIGDFWGYDGNMDASKGLSVLITNTPKGESLFESAKELLTYDCSSFEIASKKNEQLNNPVDLSKKDYSVLENWKNFGAKYLHKKHVKKHWKAFLLNKFRIIK